MAQIMTPVRCATLQMYALFQSLYLGCLQALYPEKHQELEDVLRVAETPDHLQAALTQLKGAMDKRGLHYDDLSGRPKNLCALLPLISSPKSDSFFAS